MVEYRFICCACNQWCQGAVLYMGFSLCYICNMTAKLMAKDLEHNSLVDCINILVKRSIDNIESPNNLGYLHDIVRWWKE